MGYGRQKKGELAEAMEVVVAAETFLRGLDPHPAPSTAAPMSVEAPGSCSPEVFSHERCLTLLATRQVGRVAVSRDALPAILPVTYRLLGEEVIFGTETGSNLSVDLEGDVIAFEVDDMDAVTRWGWSVLVVGVACRAGSWLRLSTDRISGRRLLVAPAAAR